MSSWRKSSKSLVNNCVEVKTDEMGCFHVRDTKQNGLSEQPVLVFTPTEWRAFIEGVKDGEFDF